MKLRLAVAAIACVALYACMSAPSATPPRIATGGAGDPAPPLPMHLRDTGLYAGASPGSLHPDAVAFSPQYPLWSDGATKRRWIRLPAGTAIDASRPDAWEFPRGTRLWKEFSVGRPIETRYLERLADGTWRFASYVWNDEGTEATLAPDEGAKVAVSRAAGGRYLVPSRTDCLACHEGPAVPVLGFGALQLSPDRDPLAPHAEPAAIDLRELVARGVVRGLPAGLVDAPPRIPAPTPVARAALGYLHANCGHCHNDAGALDGVDMALAQSVVRPDESVARTLSSLVGRVGRYRTRDASAAARVVPGHAESSVLALRIKSSDAFVRMPPLGVRVVDDEGVALVQRWIQSLPEENKP